MTNAMEASGEDMQQKAAHELLRLDHCPVPVAPIVLVGERDLVVVMATSLELAIRRAMRVAGEIGKDLGAAEGRLGVNDPSLFCAGI